MAIDIEAQKQLFKNLVSKNIHRDGIDELMNWLENETDFFTAPASTRFHCAEPGGLCLHSLNVARETVRLARTYNYSSDDTERKSPLFTEEQLYLVSLFHDICKTNFYKVGTKNQKNEATGQWEKVPFYQCEETVFVGGNGHGDKSVFLLAQHIKLSIEEMAAINNHMGFTAGYEIAVGECYEHNTLIEDKEIYFTDDSEEDSASEDGTVEIPSETVNDTLYVASAASDKIEPALPEIVEEPTAEEPTEVIPEETIHEPEAVEPAEEEPVSEETEDVTRGSHS